MSKKSVFINLFKTSNATIAFRYYRDANEELVNIKNIDEAERGEARKKANAAAKLVEKSIRHNSKDEAWNELYTSYVTWTRLAQPQRQGAEWQTYARAFRAIAHGRLGLPDNTKILAEVLKSIDSRIKMTPYKPAEQNKYGMNALDVYREQAYLKALIWALSYIATDGKLPEQNWTAPAE